MRIRCVKPDFWTDSLMVQLPILSRLIFIGTWNVADDHGWIEDDLERLRMLIMPNESAETFEPYFDILILCGRIERYQSEDGKAVLRIVNWEKHQRVDHPAKSKLSREGSRKLAIRTADRQGVAMKYGCEPGGTAKAKCYYCGFEGTVHWHKLYSGRPSFWVSFVGLELEHFIPESKDGKGVTNNLVLACRGCNRSKHDRDGLEFLANARESSRSLALEGKGREGKGKEDTSTSATPLPAEPPDLSGFAAPADDPIIMDFPNRSGTRWALTKSLFDRFVKAFPKFDVKLELERAKLWLEGQPQANRKDKTQKFLTAWLNRRAAELLDPVNNSNGSKRCRVMTPTESEEERERMEAGGSF